MLNGSEKQVKYANDIKDYVLYQLKNLDNEELQGNKEKLIKAINKVTKAEVIIKAFVDDFKLQEIQARALDFLTYNDKYTQKELLKFSTFAKTINDRLKDKKYEIVESKENVTEEKTETKEVKYATEKQITYIKKLLNNLNDGIHNVSYKIYTISSSIENRMKDTSKLTLSEASYLIENLEKHQKVSTGSISYFAAKYDTYDCETNEKIKIGDLVWKDSEGIHRADNY